MPDPNDRPRVLHVITRLNIGGPARHVLALLPGLRERGFDTLIAFGTPEPDEGELTPDPDEPSFRIAALRRPIDPASDQRAITELTRLAARYRPDVVHTHMAKGGALGRSVARRVKARAVVHTFHGHVLEGYFASPANSAFVIAERRLARRTDALIAVSESTRDDLLELGIGTPERWHVVPLALDLGPLLELEMPRDEARAVARPARRGPHRRDRRTSGPDQEPRAVPGGGRPDRCGASRDLLRGRRRRGAPLDAGGGGRPLAGRADPVPRLDPGSRAPCTRPSTW